jgi:hypothetical protein
MISAFGIDHGEISKANVKFGEYGFSSQEGRKRTVKEISRGSKVSAGHGNKQRLAAHTGVMTGLGAGLGAASTLGTGVGGKGAALGAGIGAGAGAATGLVTGKAENMERSAQRHVGGAIKRGDIRRVRHGERTTSFRNIITKD